LKSEHIAVLDKQRRKVWSVAQKCNHIPCNHSANPCAFWGGSTNKKLVMKSWPCMCLGLNFMRDGVDHMAWEDQGAPKRVSDL